MSEWIGEREKWDEGGMEKKAASKSEAKRMNWRWKIRSWISISLPSFPSSLPTFVSFLSFIRFFPSSLSFVSFLPLFHSFLLFSCRSFACSRVWLKSLQFKYQKYIRNVIQNLWFENVNLSLLSIEFQSKLILDPWVDFRTLEASVEVSFSTNLSRRQLAQLRVIACNQVGVNFFLAFPWFEIVQLGNWSGSSHPLDGLMVRYHEHVWFLDHLIQKSKENSEVLFLLEPNGVEVNSERSFVRSVMTVKVSHEHVENFIIRQVSGTGVNHRASVPLNVHWIHDHFPNSREGARGALLSRTRTSVR